MASKKVFVIFILPIILWTMNKDKSDFVDTHGKQAINFQLSLLIYGIAISIITVPIFLFSFMDSFPMEHVLDSNPTFDETAFNNRDGCAKKRRLDFKLFNTRIARVVPR